MDACVFLGRAETPCDGRIQLHHVLPRQLIRSRYRSAAYNGKQFDVPLTKVLGDKRNLVPLCWRHHQLVEGRRIYLEPDDLPENFMDFAAELNLTGFVWRWRPDAA